MNYVPNQFTRKQQIACLERQIELLKHVYRQDLKSSIITKEQVDRDLACLRTTITVLGHIK